MNTPTPRPQKDDRGVALLLTLGVLALLLLIALVFAFTANTDRMCASVNADITKARLLNKSALSRALAFLAYEYDGDSPADFFPATKAGSRFATGASGSDWENHWYMVSTMATAVADGNNLERALQTCMPFTYTASTVPSLTPPGTAASWHHVKDSDGNLIGRMFFLAIDEGGKIDPGTAVTPAPDGEPQDVNGFYFDINGNNLNNTGATVPEGTEERIGGHVQELDLSPIVGNPYKVKYCTELRNDLKKWLSWQQIYKSDIGLTPADAASHAKTLFPRPSSDPQAYREGNADIQRFSLAGTDWNAAGLFDVLKTGGSGTAVTWDGTATTTAIPWLRTLKSTTAGITDADVQNQTVANLIDYCDADDRPITDAADGGWAAGAPVHPTGTYCGLEVVPYVNEVSLLVKLSGSAVPYELQIDVDVELINIYTVPTPAAELHLFITWSGIPGSGSWTGAPTASQVSNAGTELVVPVLALAAHSYQKVAQAKLRYTDAANNLPAGSFNLNVEKVSAVIVESAAPNAVLDLAFCSTAAQAVSVSTTSVIQDFSITDARANLQSSLWTYRNSATITTYDGTVGDPKTGVNAGADPFTNPDDKTSPDYGSRDLEQTDDPASPPPPPPPPLPPPPLSTAYIRNATPRSLWELGAVHRGEPWRTINLKKWNDAAASATYANGDAILLDQVCIESDKWEWGKINPNTPNREVWKALLTGVAYGTGYDHAAAGTSLTVTEIDTYADDDGNGKDDVNDDLMDAVMAENGVSPTNGEPFNARGKIVAVPELWGGIVTRSRPDPDPSPTESATTVPYLSLPLDTDAEEEEIVGKIANLLSVRPNVFRLMVTAQAVKDLGTAVAAVSPKPASWSQYASGRWCAILAEQKMMAIVKRNPYTRVLTVETVEFLEE